jgi:RNA polymerase sigma-70 factor (ECF subfamily)
MVEEDHTEGFIENLRTESDSDKAALMTELQERLNDAFQKLSVKHRTVITLFEIDGLSHKEIADIVGTSIGTVRSRLHYAKQFLQGELKDYIR